MLTLKAWKWLVPPSLRCLTAPLRRNPSEFLDETYPAKIRGMGLPYGENCLSYTVNRLWLIYLCDRQTDGRAIAGRLKMREWKMRYGQKSNGGKCRSRLSVWKAEPRLYRDTALGYFMEMFSHVWPNKVWILLQFILYNIGGLLFCIMADC